MSIFPNIEFWIPLNVKMNSFLFVATKFYLERTYVRRLIIEIISIIINDYLHNFCLGFISF